MDDKLIDWLVKELADRGWSHRELGRRAKMSQTTISDVIAQKREATWDFCVAIAGPLDKAPEEILQMAGLLSAPGQEDEQLIKQLLDRFKQLSHERRRRVLDFVRFEYQEQGKDKGTSPGNQNDEGPDILGPVVPGKAS